MATLIVPLTHKTCSSCQAEKPIEEFRSKSRECRACMLARQSVAVNDFSAAQWVAMQAAYDHRCCYCHKRRKGRLTQDHLTPFAKGGDNTKQNIVPACSTCNRKKHTGPVLCPVQPLLL